MLRYLRRGVDNSVRLSPIPKPICSSLEQTYMFIPRTTQPSYNPSILSLLNFIQLSCPSFIHPTLSKSNYPTPPPSILPFLHLYYPSSIHPFIHLTYLHQLFHREKKHPSNYSIRPPSIYPILPRSTILLFLRLSFSYIQLALAPSILHSLHSFIYPTLLHQSIFPFLYQSILSFLHPAINPTIYPSSIQPFLHPYLYPSCLPFLYSIPTCISSFQTSIYPIQSFVPSFPYF